jgi:hypothetical protein
VFVSVKVVDNAGGSAIAVSDGVYYLCPSSSSTAPGATASVTAVQAAALASCQGVAAASQRFVCLSLPTAEEQV